MALAVKSPVLSLMILAVILDIIAVSIPYWITAIHTSKKSQIGIWGDCGKSGCGEYILTSRGLHMFALIVGIVSLICYIVTEVMELLDLKIRRILCTVLNLVAGAFILIADCYMASKIAILTLHPVCLSISLIAASFFIFIGGNLSSTISLTD